MRSIPQNIVQYAFDFEALADQPAIERVILQVIDVPPDKKFCPICKQWLDRDCFGKQSRYKDGLRYFCKSCRRDRYIADLEKDPEFNKKSAQRQRELYLAKSPEEQDVIRAHRSYLKANNPNSKISQKQSLERLRQETFTAYGSKCVDCGESNFAFLSIDHINGGGNIHRQELGAGGSRMYRWLRKQDFPHDGRFQLLCHNCNFFKLASSRQPGYGSSAHWRDVLRRETFAAYGGKCACCGENRLKVLTIDHINGGGSKYRRETGRRGGVDFYKLLRDTGFPQDEYQALCHNCNQAKHMYGVCPHQTSPH
jgi:hypothetical protein